MRGGIVKAQILIGQALMANGKCQHVLTSVAIGSCHSQVSRPDVSKTGFKCCIYFLVERVAITICLVALVTDALTVNSFLLR